MNKKLIKLLKTKQVDSGDMLDTYNQVVLKDISCTITTRVNASNEIYVIVRGKTNADKIKN